MLRWNALPDWSLRETPGTTARSSRAGPAISHDRSPKPRSTCVFAGTLSRAISLPATGETPTTSTVGSPLARRPPRRPPRIPSAASRYAAQFSRLDMTSLFPQHSAVSSDKVAERLYSPYETHGRRHKGHCYRVADNFKILSKRCIFANGIELGERLAPPQLDKHASSHSGITPATSGIFIPGPARRPPAKMRTG